MSAEAERGTRCRCPYPRLPGYTLASPLSIIFFRYISPLVQTIRLSKQAPCRPLSAGAKSEHGNRVTYPSRAGRLHNAFAASWAASEEVDLNDLVIELLREVMEKHTSKK